MASSGSKSIAVTSYDTLTFSWTLSSQSTANNTSTVAWSMVLTSTSNGKISSTASKSWSVTVNGTTYSGTNTVGIAASSSLTLASGSTTITHNSDGTKTFSYSFSQEFSITFSGVSIGTKSGTGTGTLTTIARASSITSAANVTMGNACSIKWTPASSSFTYKLKFVCGSYSYTTGTISPGSTSAYTYTGYSFPTATWAPYVTSATSATVTATLTTYSGSTSVGTAKKTFTLTVPSSVAPTVSISVAQVKEYISGKWLAGYSKPKVTITSGGTYDSTITATKTTFNSKSSAISSSVTFSAPSSSGSYTVKTTVTDSRGRTASASTTLTYVAYTAPQITGVSLIRASDTSGTADSVTGGYGYLTFGYTITSVSSTNTVNVTAKYKAKSATSYTSLASYTSTYTRTGRTAYFTADTGTSYEVVITATDAVATATKTLTLPTVSVLMNFGASGTRMGIGKIPEVSGLDIGFSVTMRKGLTLANNSTLKWLDTSGEGFTMACLNNSDRFFLGAAEYPTYLRGSAISRTTADGTFISLPEIQYGSVSITPSAANTPTGKAVTYPVTFSGTPNVVVTANSSNPGTQMLGVSAVTGTATGTTVYLTRTDTIATTVRWQAMY